MADFSVAAGLAGGALIGLSAVMLMGLLGRIAGISGITGALLPPRGREDWGWRAAFVLGLIVAPLLSSVLTGVEVISRPSENLVLMGLAGILVGSGTVIGSGCTSGHGICGLARLSARSLVAVVTFMSVAAAVVLVVRRVFGN